MFDSSLHVDKQKLQKLEEYKLKHRGNFAYCQAMESMVRKRLGYKDKAQITEGEKNHSPDWQKIENGQKLTENEVRNAMAVALQDDNQSLDSRALQHTARSAQFYEDFLAIFPEDRFSGQGQRLRSSSEENIGLSLKQSPPNTAKIIPDILQTEQASYARYETKGYGDCAFHAVFGEWDQSTGRFTCKDVATKRQVVANAIRTYNNGNNPLLSEVIKRCLERLVTEAREDIPNVGEKIAAAKEKYKEFKEKNNTRINTCKTKLEAELQKHQNIIDYIEISLTKEDKVNNISLFDKFIKYLNDRDPTEFIKKQLLERGGFKEVYEQYKEQAEVKFILKYDDDIINEYAALIGQAGTWLLSEELEILALCFDITIEMYVNDSRDIKTYGTGASVRKVYFNGFNHYEKIDERGKYMIKTQNGDVKKGHFLSSAIPNSNQPNTNPGFYTQPPLGKTVESASTITNSLLANPTNPSIGRVMPNWDPALRLSDVDKAASEEDTCTISSTLVGCQIGVDYQFQVFLYKLTELLIKDKSFDAFAEIAAHGNLDDIGICLKDTNGNYTAIEAYQIKHRYKDPIKITEFYNKDTTEDEKANGKNETMHIGKSFAGWLAWREESQSSPNVEILSIVHTNSSLYSTLDSVVDNDSFSSAFIEHKNPIYIPRVDREIENGMVYQKFLTKLDGPEMNELSAVVWEELKNKGYLDEKGVFTDLFKPDSTGFSLKLSKQLLKQLSEKNVTEDSIKKELKALHKKKITKKIGVCKNFLIEAARPGMSGERLKPGAIKSKAI